MAQDDNLDSQFVPLAAEKSDTLEGSEEREVAERGRHRPFSSAPLTPATVQVRGTRTGFGTYTCARNRHHSSDNAAPSTHAGVTASEDG